MRMKCLYIYKGKVYEIPMKQIDEGKILKKELANQTVLELNIMYETLDRKPNNVITMQFNRRDFDANGVFDIVKASYSVESGITYDYAMAGITDTINPLPIPKAPAIPTDEEIQVIKSYLNQKYPLLLKNSPNSIYEAIMAYKNIHANNIQKFKDSHKAICNK